jgi:hypothetical protein
MQVGSAEQISEEILNLGFDVKTEVTILGMLIKNRAKCYEGNAEKIIDKVRTQVRFWVRFNLSLPGRIIIAKTFMYSQLTYLGCFVPLNDTTLNGISLLIEDFVNGPLRISRRRIFQKRTEGGLELINIRHFLNSQTCVWVKRAQDLRDNWKIRLYRGSYGDIFNLRSKNFNRNTEPILFNIAKNFEQFIFEHTKINSNYKKSYIFENPVITFAEGVQGNLGERFLADEMMIRWGDKIRNLKVTDFLMGDGTPISF